ncbi:anthranilate phosphoribosyltransferase [Flavobacterium ardleyense]|uniref:anthranilate phosphoribosyltransferase n=1 Tax=Flavobacterium ardleyense TaxID=2038737 RepID=UPI00298CF0FD|nr:anthranilate phosphoribosyltransferase [Flavobacterium ardleyense]
MKTILNRLINHEVLDKQEAKNVLINISKGNYNSNQIASFLTVYMMRTVTIEELEGFRDALLEMCVRIDLSDFNTIDLCGTGGDGKDTFNISTLSAFVVAGAEIKVAKHGNYGVSSISGSSNVLEMLGVKFSSNNEQLKRSLDHAGICVMHAPLFHPALKNVGQIRKDLAIKTFFNMLGPMVNPSFPKNQLVGVFNLEIARMYAYLYQNSEVNFAILHSMDGYDEISLTGPTKIIKNNQEGIFEPAHFGLSVLNQNAIKGGNTVDESAKIFYDIISGNGTQAQQDVVCANAAIAIATVENCTEQEGFERARRSLLSGNAKKSLERLIEMN